MICKASTGLYLPLVFLTAVQPQWRPLSLHYAGQALIQGICIPWSLFLVYFGHRPVCGSFMSRKSQFKYIFSSDRYFLINQSRAAIPPLNDYTAAFFFFKQLWYLVHSFVSRGPKHRKTHLQYWNLIHFPIHKNITSTVWGSWWLWLSSIIQDLKLCMPQWLKNNQQLLNIHINTLLKIQLKILPQGRLLLRQKRSMYIQLILKQHQCISPVKIQTEKR